MRVATGYTSGMKTAISIPDDLFVRADELADELPAGRDRWLAEASRRALERSEW